MNALTDEQVISQKNDAEMIRRAWLWPQTLLPLKRIHDGEIDTAVVCRITSDGRVYVIEGTTIFGPVTDKIPTRRIFRDAEAVVADGWRVD
jgi:hypothetical protein